MDKAYAIFDMDGTLVDSMAYWKGLAEEFLAEKGISPLPEDLMERIKPMTMAQSAALFITEFGLEGNAESVAEEMNAMIEGHYRRDIPLKEGAAEYLAALRAKGVRLCVASATAKPLMTDCLRRLGVLDCFEFLLSCEELNAGKDRPDVYYAAAERFGAAAADTAVYEDALYAARTAKEAGFYVVAVYDEEAGERWDRLAALADEQILNWRNVL